MLKKIWKIVVKVFSAIVLLLIFLPLVVALFLSLPSVQNYAVNSLAKSASAYLGTTVRIEHITVGLLNKVQIRGFYVEDLDRDTLLYASKVSAYISPIQNFRGGLNFAVARLEGACFHIAETERGNMNIKEVVEKLQNRKKNKKPFAISISSIYGSGIHFTLSRNATRNYDKAGNRTPVKYEKMDMHDITTTISNFYVAGSGVGGDISKLSLREVSGFKIESASGKFGVDRGLVAVDNFNINTPNSTIRLDSLRLIGGEWSAYKDFINNVKIIAHSSSSKISSEDVGYFAPAIWGWDTTLKNLTLDFNGTVADFRGKVKNATTEDGGTIVADCHIKGLTNISATNFDISIHKIDIHTPQIEKLLTNIAHIKFGDGVQKYITRVGKVRGSGKFRGKIHNFKANGDITLGSGGQAKIDIALVKNRLSATNEIDAKIEGNQINIGTIVANTKLGNATLALTAKGGIGKDNKNIAFEGGISSLAFNEAIYNNITTLGTLVGDDVKANIAIEDKKLCFDADAKCNLIRHEYSANLALDRADLNAMNINHRDSISVASGDITLAIAGATIDTMEGNIDIVGGKYQHGEQNVESDLVSIKLESNEDTRHIILQSDFADAIFECRSSYADVLYYLRTILNRYLPAMYSQEQQADIENHKHRIENNVAIVSLTAKNLDPLLSCFVEGLEVAPASRFRMLVSPAENRIMAILKADYIVRNRLMATAINLNLTNRSDSLSLTATAEDFYIGTMKIANCNLESGIKDSKISLNTSFADSLTDVKGRLSATANIFREQEGRKVNIDISPSYIAHSGGKWNISCRGIQIGQKRVSVDNLKIHNKDQVATLNGVASDALTDSITLKLQNFSLSPFVQVASSMGYSITGRTNGYAQVKSALSGGQIDAKIGIDSIDVNGLPLPAMRIRSRWDFARSRASLSMLLAEKGDTIVRGYYSPRSVRYYAHLNTKKLDMSLLNPLLKGVISGTKGTAHADLELYGERTKAQLKGVIDVSNFSTLLDYTNCTYKAKRARVVVDNNHFIMDKVAVTDTEGGTGTLNMNLSLNHLKNIEYHLSANINNMLALNTSIKENEMFYGKVYASGIANVRGDKSGVTLDIAARSEDNSQFFMPLSGKANISRSDFVTFRKADSGIDTTSYLLRRKLMFERRQKQRTSGGGNMEINMALDVRPNAEIQLVVDPTVGDIIKGRGEGTLNLRINPKSNIFEMYGDYTISEGSYLFTLQNIINKKFIINPGSTIQWTGEPLDARLGIDAVYKLKASLQPLLEGYVATDNISTRAVPVNCIIHLTDRLTHPSVDFDVEVPQVDASTQTIIADVLSTPERRSQQFLYLLVANSFIAENNSNASMIGVSSAAATGFELLSNQLSNWLSTDDYNIILRYRPKTEKMNSDEVDVGFSKGIANNRLLLEVSGNYIADKSQMVNATSNFTGEAYLTWLIDKAGALRLKGFTHTIDRFDENQGLQETGVGIYYKEDFDNGKDLKERFKSYFKRDKNRKKRKKEKLDTDFSQIEKVQYDMYDTQENEIDNYD